MIACLAQSRTIPQMHRFYFRSKDDLFYECIWADSFIEAKQKAFLQYSVIWNQIEWINPEAGTEEDKTRSANPIPVVISA